MSRAFNLAAAAAAAAALLAFAAISDLESRKAPARGTCAAALCGLVIF